MKRLVIAVATYNRPIITRLCLENLSKFRAENVRLVIYDDASDLYPKSFLEQYADETVRFGSKGGIERSRARTFRDFCYRFQDYDLLYLTDNDTIHDPDFVNVLLALFDLQESIGSKRPISLYNSNFHNSADNIIFQNDVIYLQKTFPGISQCYDRTAALKIINFLNQNPEFESMPNWDYIWPIILNTDFIVTKTSYLEHFARDRFEAGMHCENSGLGSEGLIDFERDRAANPTVYLQEIRSSIIQQLLGLVP